MDIKQLLIEHGHEIFASEFDLLRSEINTGNYSESYKLECNELLNALIKKRKEDFEKKESNKTSDKERKNSKKVSSANNMESKLELNVNQVIPEEQQKEIVEEETLIDKIYRIREESNHISLFKNMILKDSSFNQEFFDQNFTFLQKSEVNAVLCNYELSEVLLEKYFDVLDKEIMARHQHFSEEFFIKHYPDFNVETVLLKGINSWRTSENRSKKLDVFLRVKGVKL